MICWRREERTQATPDERVFFIYMLADLQQQAPQRENARPPPRLKRVGRDIYHRVKYFRRAR